MHLRFERFQREHYPEYASWFVDPELSRHLGPMDEDWLDAVRSEPELAGVTWAVFRDNEMVAVVETAFDPENQVRAAITAVAVRPDPRRQGIGTAALRLILSYHRHKGIKEHVMYISMDNPAGQRCAEKVGFVPVTSKTDEQGYMELRCGQSQTGESPSTAGRGGRGEVPENRKGRIRKILGYVNRRLGTWS